MRVTLSGKKGTRYAASLTALDQVKGIDALPVPAGKPERWGQQLGVIPTPASKHSALRSRWPIALSTCICTVQSVCCLCRSCTRCRRCPRTTTPTYPHRQPTSAHRLVPTATSSTPPGSLSFLLLHSPNLNKSSPQANLRCSLVINLYRHCIVVDLESSFSTPSFMIFDR